jgi:hypothetical protein
MRHANGDANGDSHIHSDADSDGYSCLTHTDGDCNAHADCDTNVDCDCDCDGNCYSDRDRIAAFYTDASASGDAAASPIGFFEITGTREIRTREFPAQSRSTRRGQTTPD